MLTSPRPLCVALRCPVLPCAALCCFIFSTRASDLSERICCCGRCDLSHCAERPGQCLTGALVLCLVACLDSQHALVAHSCPHWDCLHLTSPSRASHKPPQPPRKVDCSLSLPEGQDAIAGDDGPATGDDISPSDTHRRCRVNDPTPTRRWATPTTTTPLLLPSATPPKHKHKHKHRPLPRPSNSSPKSLSSCLMSASSPSRSALSCTSSQAHPSHQTVRPAWPEAMVSTHWVSAH